MIFVKNSRGGREVNMVNTLSKIKEDERMWSPSLNQRQTTAEDYGK